MAALEQSTALRSAAPAPTLFAPRRARGGAMVARVNTVAFQGIEVREVDVQVQMASGLPAFTIVGSIAPID